MGGMTLREFVRRHRMLVLIQLPLGVVSLAVLVWRVDLAEAVRRLPDVDYRWAAPGLLVFTASKFLHAYRWRVFLGRREHLPLRQLFAIFLTSNLANAVIPLRAGDLLRIELPNRRFGIPRAELTGSVIVVETLLDGVAFVILMFVGLVLLDVPPLLPSLLGFMALAVGVAFAVTVVLARVDGERDFSTLWPLRWLPVRLRARAAVLLPQFLDGLASLRDVGGVSRAVGISLVAWLAEVGVYWMMGQAFGLELDAATYLPIMIGANLIVSIPLTPWDLGPYEVVVTEVTVLAGAARGVASGFAVGSHLLLLAWIGVTGMLAMWALDLEPRELLRGGEARRERR
jgi:uncharacterized protein (TIRG00374 family)